MVPIAVPLDLHEHRPYSKFHGNNHPSKEALNLKINPKLKPTPKHSPAPGSKFSIFGTNDLPLPRNLLDESGLELEQRYHQKLLADIKHFRVPLPHPHPQSTNSGFQYDPLSKTGRRVWKEEVDYLRYITGLPSSSSLILNDRTLLKISQSSSKQSHVEERKILRDPNERGAIQSRIKREVTLPHCLFVSGPGENRGGIISNGCWIGEPQLLGNGVFCYKPLTPLPPQKLSPVEVTSALPSVSPPLSFHPLCCSYVSSSIVNGSGGICSTFHPDMKGKGNRNSSASTSDGNQVTGSTNQSTTPRTPGTPSSGAHTPNPPTPGNNNSNSMVGSSPQYVAITVEAGPSGGNDSDMSSGGNQYVTYVEDQSNNTIYATAATTAAANGQNMSYPLYASVSGGGETTTVYGSGSGNSTHYFSPGSSSNGVAYTQEGGVYLVQSPSSNNNIISVDGGGGSANLTNRVSPATKRRKTVPELCPISVPVGGATSIPRVRRAARPEVYYDDGENVYFMEEISNANHSSAYSNSGAEPGSSSMIPELDNFGYDGVMHGIPSGSDMESHFDTSGDDPLVYSTGANAAAIRTNPLTVQWLLENYETAEGVSLPRSTLYNHYLRHCSEHKLDPVNAASFGKLIRSVFIGLRTRRLGTRGNSKYHYYGIRLKPNSPLNHVKDDVVLINGNYASNGHHNASAGNTQRGGGGGGSNAGHQHHNGGGSGMGGGSGANANKRLKPAPRNDMNEGGNVAGLAIGDANVFLQYLGDCTGSVLDDFPELDAGNEAYPDGIVENDLFVFRTLYREHCKVLLEALVNFQLSQFEINWKIFWRGGDMTDVVVEGAVDHEKILPKSKMLALSRMKVLQDFVKTVDYNLYQHIVEMLLPDVLRPIPSAMTQAIRNFAKVLESWVSSSMTGYPEAIVSLRLTVVNALAQTLRRYTSLNHLAQAARAVLQNQSQISQMLADLNRVDFRNVEEQASWVCGCVGDTVSSLEQDFKATLSQQQTLDEWASWLEKVVDKVMKPYENSPNFVSAARNFLLKWSFYSSLIIRDLTLRSAASFGSFHLLRLLYDEYIFYVVEHRVAKVTGVVPIQVIGKKSPGLPFAESSSSEQQQQRVDTAKGHKSNGGGTMPNPVSVKLEVSRRGSRSSFSN